MNPVVHTATPTTKTRTRPGVLAELRVDAPRTMEVVPIECGVCLPRGVIAPNAPLSLRDDSGQALPTQAETLATWPDGSPKWVLLATVVDHLLEGRTTLSVVDGDSSLVDDLSDETRPSLEVEQRAGELVLFDGLTDQYAATVDLTWTTDRGRVRRVRWGQSVVERSGAIVQRQRFDGRIPGSRGCRARMRVTSFPRTGLVRIDLALHNPNRARHRGGYWDLGDPGSVFLQACTLDLDVRRSDSGDVVEWTETPGGETRFGESLSLAQLSSGGEHWQASNHVDRTGRVPLHFPGCRVRSDGLERFVPRVTPTASLVGQWGRLGVAVPEFWERFPASLEFGNGRVSFGLLPDTGTPHELQGGERLTRTIWIAVGRPSFDWVHEPPNVTPTAASVARSEAVWAFEHDPEATARLDRYVAPLVRSGERAGSPDLLRRREVVDEYGWRNFGDFWADHEQAFFAGEGPVVSHYNNQFDVVHALLQQFLRTGNARWQRLLGPLARHVVDVDLYHTDRDRPQYNGGLFWHTDHYVDAATATHRSYSRSNAPHSPGGGPSCEHNYTTGLLHHHFLTGEPDSRDAVLQLADWVVAMEDGSRTPFSLVDDGPTGAATSTYEPGYHGPGRGAGNSVNALIDAWSLTGEKRYLEFAEGLIRRVVHPRDDVDALELLDVERRWSYTVFLVALARYLDAKIESEANDEMYAYGVASLLHYAEWMLEHEVPYFDRADQLEYPTEAWAAQEFRKANALRLAARHADDPLRERLLVRADEFSRRAWEDLERFDSRHTTRAAVIVINEGLREAFLAHRPDVRLPPPSRRVEFGTPQKFVPEKERFREALRTPGGLLRITRRLCDPRRWPALLDACRRYT